jgi:small GTP-binding protein
MPAFEPGKIRNVAVVGHRGTGKTSLVEALLFQAGETNRLGTIDAGSTIADWDDDEQQRKMSISLALTHAEWQGRKLNLIDVPGDPSFQGEARCSLRVVEGALFVLSGVMGVEVGTTRLWKRADELGIARVCFVNMLDRERADFYRALGQMQEQLSPRCVAVHLPIGSEHELTGIVDILHMCSYASPEGGKEPEPGPIPDDMADAVAEYREKLLDEVVQTDEALMERYLEEGDLPLEDVDHPMVKMRAGTANQAIANSGPVVTVDFAGGSVVHDLGAGLTADLANDRIVVDEAGYYVFTGRVSFSTNATGYRALLVTRVAGAGDQFVADDYRPAVPSQATTITLVTEEIYCAAGEAFSLQVLQNSGATINLQVTNGRPAVFSARQVRRA